MCEHCWHDHLVLFTDPIKVQQYCCHCGDKRILQTLFNKVDDRKHGPYANG